MRSVVLTAALLLVAGCSQSTGGQAGPAPTLTPLSSKPRPTVSPSTPATTATATSPVRGAPPSAGAPMPGVIAWVQGGAAASPDEFHTAVRDGVSTQLGDDIAFVTPAGTKCMTDAKNADGGLACLLRLRNPPPRPAAVEGEWVGGWVDFDGTTVQVGSAHGDPGRFTRGTGPELTDGATLRFGDFACRADETALYCIDFAHQSGVRLADSGVGTFGCLHAVDAPADGGLRFSC